MILSNFKISVHLLHTLLDFLNHTLILDLLDHILVQIHLIAPNFLRINYHITQNLVSLNHLDLPFTVLFYLNLLIF